jgi:hypothetical protein
MHLDRVTRASQHHSTPHRLLLQAASLLVYKTRFLALYVTSLSNVHSSGKDMKKVHITTTISSGPACSMAFYWSALCVRSALKSSATSATLLSIISISVRQRAMRTVLKLAITIVKAVDVIIARFKTWLIALTRKDFLVQHVRGIHLKSADESIWKTFKIPGAWSKAVDLEWIKPDALWCGFCHHSFLHIPERMVRVANHFRNGRQMKNWVFQETSL